MKEKVMVRIQEVNIWANLMESLENMEKYAKQDLTDYMEQMKEVPDDERADDWRNKNCIECSIKLKAIENIRVNILKAIG